MNGRLLDFRKKLEQANTFLSKKDSVEQVSKYFPNLVEMSGENESIECQSILIDNLTELECNDVRQMNQGRVNELATKCKLTSIQVVEFLLQFMVVQHSPSEKEAASFFEELERFRVKIGGSQ